ncbi:MAG: inositol monophosphatase family protein [Vampirovibrionia bacterium]
MDNSTKEKLFITAKKAALKAGEIHLKYYGKEKQIEYKANEFDLVTNADKESEEIIINTIKESFPEHDILAEESQKTELKTDYVWIIDPLDGTTNYAHNFPQFCVSIAVMYKGEIIVGIVYDAVKKEFFHGIKDEGAWLNDKKIEVSSIKEVSKSLLATGFPYNRTNKETNNFNYFEAFSLKSQAIRRPGSAALDLCYLACGRFDGFWELTLAPWDTAAGSLIVKEAGGKVTNFFSDNFDIFIRNIHASNPYIYDEMQSILKTTNPNIPII